MRRRVPARLPKKEKANVILNKVKDLGIQTSDYEILHFVQNDKC